MSEYSFTKVKTVIATAVMMALLTGCGKNESPGNNAIAMFEVDVTNATNAQPMTPLAVIAHTSAFLPWELGSPASVGLEKLAESGDVSQFLADADSNGSVMATASSNNGPFGPGATESVMLSVKMPASDLEISVASMLADTNDAFTGVANVAVGDLKKGDKISFLSRVYDAGTEANTESSATIPGPAGGGEGFNAARDDTNFVSIHSGVVTADDGLTSSALNEGDRWLGPAAKITITRVN